MNYFKITTAVLFAVIMLGCQNDPIKLTIDEPANSTTSLALEQTALSKLPALNGYTQIVTGYYHVFVIKTDGTLWGWGLNNSGQLGANTFEDILTPRQVGTDTDWKILSTGEKHTLALKNDGTLWAWGDNEYGQLGNGTTDLSAIPIQIGTENTWTSIEAGKFHNLALKSDGTLWAWGSNSNGQLGDGNTTVTYRSSPVQEIKHFTNWKSISAGDTYSTALTTLGTIWSWGSNFTGQLGNGTYDSAEFAALIDSGIHATPVQEITNATDWMSVTAGNYHTIALKIDGTLWGWGRGYSGELGFSLNLPGSTVYPSPQQEYTKATNWISISAGAYFSTAIKSDGSLWTWGTSGYGRLGQGYGPSLSYPHQVGTSTSWKSVVAGALHCSALKSDGTIWEWGSNAYYQMGDGTQTLRVRPANLSGDIPWTDIVTGGGHTLGLKEDGTLWAWGANNFGELGDSTTVDNASPEQIDSNITWKSVSTGGNHNLAIKSDGTLWAWGLNSNGELGDGGRTTSLLPKMVDSNTTWQSVAAGSNFSHAIRNDGTLWGWGNSKYGQVGDGSIGVWSYQANITQIGVDTNWQSIAAGGLHIIALKTDGTLWAWGDNSQGQLGDGTITTRTTPVQESSLATNWTDISAGANHSIGIKSDGTLWTWGLNDSGQLGDASLTNTSSPIQETTHATNWASAVAGSKHTIALKADQTLWAWGSNNWKQLGDGTLADQQVATQIGTDTTWQAITASDSHSLAIKGDGYIWVWGANTTGQLGVGSKSSYIASATRQGMRTYTNLYDDPYEIFTLALDSLDQLNVQGYNVFGQLGLYDTTYRTSFEKPYPYYTWEQIAIGKNHVAGIQKDGTLWAWGNNQHKQLGYTTFDTYQSFITQVNGETDWLKVVCGDKFTVALKTDGTLWAWGDNSAGQLGLGTLSLDPLVPTPVQVGTQTHWTDIFAYKDALYVQKNDGTIWGAGNLIYFGLLQ